MIWRLRMYMRFLAWLIVKGCMLFSFIPEFFAEWRDEVRKNFASALLIWLIVTVCTITCTVVGHFLFVSMNEQPPITTLTRPLMVSSVLFLCVTISALYGVFLEEYEETFTILKDENL
jgi:hypothetical protein